MKIFDNIKTPYSLRNVIKRTLVWSLFLPPIVAVSVAITFAIQRIITITYNVVYYIFLIFLEPTEAINASMTVTVLFIIISIIKLLANAINNLANEL